jgi:GH15 family glucan-1,4-alpha-glucosidase
MLRAGFKLMECCVLTLTFVPPGGNQQFIFRYGKTWPRDLFTALDGPTTMINALSNLRSHLQALETLARATNPSGRQLQEQFLVAQQHFQQQLLPLAEPYPSAQPVLTEINRTLRLLAMDVAFLQTARQSATTQQRQQQMLTKLGQLLNFCEAMAQAIANEV